MPGSMNGPDCQNRKFEFGRYFYGSSRPRLYASTSPMDGNGLKSCPTMLGVLIEARCLRWVIGVDDCMYVFIAKG